MAVPVILVLVVAGLGVGLYFYQPTKKPATASTPVDEYNAALGKAATLLGQEHFDEAIGSVKAALRAMPGDAKAQALERDIREKQYAKIMLDADTAVEREKFGDAASAFADAGARAKEIGDRTKQTAADTGNRFAQALLDAQKARGAARNFVPSLQLRHQRPP